MNISLVILADELNDFLDGEIIHGVNDIDKYDYFNRGADLLSVEVHHSEIIARSAHQESGYTAFSVYQLRRLDPDHQLERELLDEVISEK